MPPGRLMRNGMTYRRRPVLSSATFFITSVTYQRKPYFAASEYAQIVVDQWLHYAAAYQFDLMAYCVMPDHYHAVLNVGATKTISQISPRRQFLQRNFGQSAFGARIED